MHKSIVSKFMVMITFIMLVGCACTTKISYNSSAILKKTTKSVVKINASYITQDKVTLATVQKAYWATGFSIATKDAVSLVLTNRHVCEMGANANYILTLQSGNKIQAMFIKSDPFADICILKVKTVIPPLSLAKENSSRGDRVITIGGPDGVFPLMVDGLVSGYYNIQMKNNPDDDDGDFEIHFRSQVMSAPIYPGSSGSPVLNTNGDVIGIVFAVRGEKAHISFMVPVNEIWRFLNTEEDVYIN